MYLLYLDESGNESDPKDKFFVLGGIALFERQTFFLSKSLDELQQKHFPDTEPIAFHVNEIRAGRGFRRKVEKEKRKAVLEDMAAVLSNSPHQGRRAFAVAIEKSSALHGYDAVESATELILRSFDLLLRRRYHQNNPQRGLLIFSEGRFDARAKLWVRDFHRKGTQWGAISNLADLPYFASMKDSRLLQAADYVASSVRLYYERGDNSLLVPILGCFDSDKSDKLYGLVHHKKTSQQPCACFACESRKAG